MSDDTGKGCGDPSGLKAIPSATAETEGLSALLACALVGTKSRNAAMTVKIHELFVSTDESVYVLTTLPDNRKAIGNDYKRRGDVERTFRELKVAMKMEELR